ncbi:hypothetical protein MRX96_013843 [Rhipicephalus microplus]
MITKNTEGSSHPGGITGTIGGAQSIAAVEKKRSIAGHLGRGRHTIAAETATGEYEDFGLEERWPPAQHPKPGERSPQCTTQRARNVRRRRWRPRYSLRRNLMSAFTFSSSATPAAPRRWREERGISLFRRELFLLLSRLRSF